MKTWTSTTACLVVVGALGILAGCVPTSGFTIGGNVTEINGQLELSLNNSETISINSAGSYRFTNRLNTGDAYSVSVSTPPSSQTCSVSNGTGVIGTTSIRNVNVVCTVTPTFSVTGSVEGLRGELSLGLNNSESIILNADGSFAFITDLIDGEAYDVVVNTQPAGQQCAIDGGSGAIDDGDAQVAVHCVTTALPPEISSVSPNPVLAGYDVTVTGNNLDIANITFNSVAVNPTSRSASEIHFTAPENPQGTYLLEAKNIAGGDNTSVRQGKILDHVIDLSLGNSHACAVTNDGLVYCWGVNFYGQLGNGTQIDSSSPIEVAGIHDAVAVSSGGLNTCALLSNGSIKCWGTGSHGVLGNGTTVEVSSVPVVVSNITNASSISVGTFHACATLTDKTIKCWGGNPAGALGNPSVTYTLIPIAVEGIDNAVSVSASKQFHTCAALDDGKVKCWGHNPNGELGDGTRIDKPLATTVIGVENAVAVATGIQSSYALLSDGSVYCWGYYCGDTMYYLGLDGDNRPMYVYASLIPTPVTGLTNAVAISGSFHACAALDSGLINCWARNNVGQMGLGYRDTSYMPMLPVATEVLGISNAKSVSTDYGSTCALLESGVVHCWGTNPGGVLGIASPAELYQPGLPVHFH